MLAAFEVMRSAATRHHEEFDAIVKSAAILAYGFEHQIAAPDVAAGGPRAAGALMKLRDRGRDAAAWVDADWCRNRYPDDPNRDAIYLIAEHLLHRLREMNAYHEALLRKRHRQSSTGGAAMRRR